MESLLRPEKQTNKQTDKTRKLVLLETCHAEHPAPLSQSFLMVDPWESSNLPFPWSHSRDLNTQKDFIKSWDRAEKNMLSPIIVPGFMLALMHHSCKTYFLLYHQNPGVQYKCTNPCNFLVMQATGVLISSRRGEVKSCQAHKTKKQTFRASCLFPLFSACLYSFLFS